MNTDCCSNIQTINDILFFPNNVVKIEIEASTENKARVNAEIKARKKYNTNFVKSVNVKYLGIYKES